jgi:hypothetical protein
MWVPSSNAANNHTVAKESILMVNGTWLVASNIPFSKFESQDLNA